MKEKIERLSKGIFQYDTPSLFIQPEELEISTPVGTISKGSFTIENSSSISMKGVIYSSSKFLVLHTNTFSGTQIHMDYEFNGTNLSQGDTIKGHLTVISSCGESKIPFIANVEGAYFDSSLGKIKDLFNFTNLAKTDVVQALKLFKNEGFPSIFTEHEETYKSLYKELLKSKSTSSGMEEFLIAVHKKLPVRIAADKQFVHVQVWEEGIKEKVILTKDHWGYGEYKITTDAPFITLDHKRIWTENFIGNQYNLEFILHPENMRYGNNFGKIYIKSPHQLISIEVVCKRNKNPDNAHYLDRTIRQLQVKLLQNYIEFRKGKLHFVDYSKKGNELLHTLLNKKTSYQSTYELMRIHLQIAGNIAEGSISTNEEIIRKELEEFIKLYPNLEKQEKVVYCGYEYLLALLEQDDETIEGALRSIYSLYKREVSHYMLLWFILHMDKKYDKNNGLKLQEIKEQYGKGCVSPILLFEAATIYNENPSLAHELKNFEISVFYWSMKEGYISKEAAGQFAYLASKLKNYNYVVYRTLVGIYKEYKEEETLSSICSLLIKGHKRGKEFFQWYELGVQKQLRITELYEYYMYSLEDEDDFIATDFTLPQPILLYFIYNSNISDKKKAYLYAYIIKNKEELSSIYKTYYKKMEIFALKQLSGGNISYNLSIIYQEFIEVNELREEMKPYLPSVMFSCRIECKNPNIKGVYVVHEERSEGVFTPLVGGKGIVHIFTDNYNIILWDNEDNFYVAGAEYTIHRLMPYEEYLAYYEGEINLSPMLLLHQAGKILFYQKFDDESLALRKELLELPVLSKKYRTKNLLDLIHYHYDNIHNEGLDSYLSKVVLSELEVSDQYKVISMYISRGMEELAIAGLKDYKYEGIGLNKLVRLCTRLLQNVSSAQEPLLDLASYIFRERKHNETILAYLTQYYYGATGEMFLLWEGARELGLDTLVLEERLLCQMLFIESYLVNSVSVFLHYYKNGTNRKLIRGFLSFHAFKYLTSGRTIIKELFDIIKKELLVEQNDICMLALIKHYSLESVLTESEIQLIDYNIHRFVSEGIIFPFFTEFKDYIDLPSTLKDKYFIEYYTNPANRVMIHYRLEDLDTMDQYVEEEMKHMYMGIYVKDFILFTGERIQYYITEIKEDVEKGIREEIITESVTGSLDESLEGLDTKYSQINDMITAFEMQDDQTLFHCMENFIQQKYVINQVFTPL